ncbi:MAG: DUF4870 family protein [Porticoccaceae bacterium]
MNTERHLPQNPVSQQQKNLVQLVYILQAASFLIGISAIAAIIVNYLKKDDVRGTWLESHFQWQIKTFWYAVAGIIVGLVLLVVLIGGLVLFATMLWVIYRIVKGWLAFNDGKEIANGFF